MPGLPPPVDGEQQTLLQFLAFQQNAFVAIAFGLTDEQARATPAASTLSIGGLVKHAAGVQRGWVDRVVAAPAAPAPDPRPMDEVMTAYADEYVMRADETLTGLLDSLRAQNAETLRVLTDCDLDTPVPIPRDVPWFPKDVQHWSARWVILHLVEELSRHAGHGDIIRESLDGATMYELMAGAEGWPETDWLTPWRPG